jgi:tetratricopeptide (TPR) repeat protein
LRGRALNGLSAVMIYTGRYSEAEATLTEALALNRTWPQRDNPDVGVSLNNYGVLYQLTGQQKKSVEALRQAVAIDEKVLGADNSLSLINDVMLADALRVSGQYAEAGAKAVLATLWPVADASTAALMQALYQLTRLIIWTKRTRCAKRNWHCSRERPMCSSRTAPSGVLRARAPAIAQAQAPSISRRTPPRLMLTRSFGRLLF